MGAEDILEEAGLHGAPGALDRLRTFSGSPESFWTAFLEALVVLAGARAALLLTRGGPGWQKLRVWPCQNTPFQPDETIDEPLDRLATLAEKQGTGLLSGAGGPASSCFAAVRLLVVAGAPATVAVLRLENSTQEAALGATKRLQLAADVPLIYDLNSALRAARQDTGRFAAALDLLVAINAQTRFRAAAMVLCNELASRHHCERASLGWLAGDYLRLQAISHSEKFEKKMAVVRVLETAMEEALDQDAEIVWPPEPAGTKPDTGPITRDHENFARAQSVNHLASLPIRIEGRAVGVLTLERASPVFSFHELQGLRLQCDQAARRLDDLRLRDRWIGARIAGLTREKLAKLLGAEHTWAKLAALAIAALLGVLIFGKKTYRVEAPFLVKSDILAQIAAPFDGYIDEVAFRIGDPVDREQTLLALDVRDLLLQEAAAAGERQRYLAEAQKAESDRNVADMRIALATAEQAKARLELVQFHVSQAKIRAPFAGIVVEGDLRERVAAPVKQGEVLLKVARIEAMYPSAEVPERDIHEIKEGAMGEIAFASRPQFSFPVRVERIEPVAEAKEKGNVFTVRCVFTTAAEGWWRPGMSGVCKINSGPRSLLWIFAHRTVDFLRLYFWW